MRPLLLSLPLLAACRGCDRPTEPSPAMPSGTYGHETMELTVGSHGDHLVAALAALYDGGEKECACLLDMRRSEPGRWIAQHAGQQVELLLTDDEVVIQPAVGTPVDLACCGEDWPGDRAPRASRRPPQRCRTDSQAATVFLPVPYVEEPEESEWTTYEGDPLLGTRLFRAFDVWVLVELAGPTGLVGMVRIEDLDCEG
jgi:hypothetical protein